MSDAADIDVLAAEYVLGTLDASERVQIAGRLEREPALRSAVADWEQRLQPLTQLVRPVEPPSGLLSKIEQTLALSLASSGVLAASAGSSNVVNMDLQRSLRRWRSTAIAASAMAASLAVVLGLREVARPSVDQNFVAVFQKDDASPSFVMAVDLTKRTLSVQRVAADVPAGKTYQLWIAR